MKKFSEDDKVFAFFIGWIWFVLALIFLFTSVNANAQEQYIRACQTSAACVLDQAVSWGSTTRTYVFTPIQPNVSIRIWIHNNNTTSVHSAQAITAFVTNSTIANASLLNNGDIWAQAQIQDNSIVGAQCANVNKNNPTGAPGANGMGTCYSSGMWAAQIAIQFNPGGGAAGSPDTFDIGLVQQPSVTPSGAQPGNAYGLGSGALTANVAAIPTAPVDLQDGGAIPGFQVYNYVLQSAAGNGTWERWRGTTIAAQNGDSDARSNTATAFVTNPDGTNSSSLADYPSFFNGATWDRSRAQSSSSVTSSSNATGTTLPGIMVSTSPATWSVPVQAASASNCSASVAASATTRHCAVGVEACVSATAAQTQLFINLRDGATGAGTVKWNGVIAGAIGTFGCVVHEFAAGVICGTANTAMTLELSGATAATNGCALTVHGYDVQ